MGTPLVAKVQGSRRPTAVPPGRIPGSPTLLWCEEVLRCCMNASTLTVRPAEQSEIPQLARVWYEAWRDAHLDHLPAQLIRVRTLESFRDRLEANLAPVRVVGPLGAPLGLCAIRVDELYQLFVAAEARGSGAAQALLADGEQRLRAKGVRRAWLSCAIGNDRAARFYEKCGWRRVGTMVADLETTEGPFRLKSWRYEKGLLTPPVQG